MGNLQFPSQEPSLWNIPGDPDLYFIGRQEPLSFLNQESGIFVLYGPHGIGKTAIVKEFLYQNKSKYDVGWWISCRSVETIHAALTVFADLNGIKSDTLSQWLQNNSRWLLIYDGADEPQIVLDFLPRSSKGTVVMTSIASEWPASVSPFKILPFTEDESLLFLKKRLLFTEKEEALRQLSFDLGYLPLSLRQAADYINLNRMTIEDYRSEIQAGRINTVL